MKKWKLWLKIGLVLCTFTLLAGCGKEKEKKKNTVSIGILQLTDHQALDEAREGFLAELKKQGYEEGKNLTVDFQNAQGDQANLKSMSERLANNKNDVNLAIATQAAQSMEVADKTTPLLFTAITDPVDAGLVKNLKTPGGNVTGTSDKTPIKEQMKLLTSIVPDVKKVGLLYNSSEPNSRLQIEQAKKELKTLKLQTEEMTVTSTNDVEQVTQSMVKKVDVVYIPSDNTFTSAMATVGDISRKSKVPVIPATAPMVDLGGIATYGIDYRKLGEQTARMAVKILKKESKPENMPVETLDQLQLVVNKKMAKDLGIDPKTIKAPK